jgi:hypothetical protein
LDEVVQVPSKFGMMKIDVEGHELEVLEGARLLFENGGVRDCIFEEHHAYPTPVCNWFEAMGYRVFRLDRTFFKPTLLPPDSPIPRTHWTATNFLATNDPQRAQSLFSARGWNCLKYER